jgi:hypothetical protein
MGPGYDPYRRRFIELFTIPTAVSNIGNLKGVDEMEKKLYRVKVVLYVMAENESEACLAATNAHFDIFECAARLAKYVDPEWNNAVPYNADNEQTCLEIMSQQPQSKGADLPLMKLPDYVDAAIQVFQRGNSSFQPGQPS